MKKTRIILLLLILLIVLTACGTPYKRQYKALSFKRNSKDNYCSFEFKSFEGVFYYKIKNTNTIDGKIDYFGSLEEGELNVYYGDENGNKEVLFNINGSETMEDSGGYIESGSYVYIIIETTTKSIGGEIIITFNN